MTCSQASSLGVLTNSLRGVADPITHALTILGSFPASLPHETIQGEKSSRLPAIICIEKTALSLDVLQEGVLGDLRVIETTDIVRLLGPLFIPN